jgi:hypothetical protein
VLLTGIDDEFDLNALVEEDEQTASWDEETVEFRLSETDDTQQLPSSYDPERAARVAHERVVAEVRERDEVVARVGNLFLAVESLLRLLKNKGMINDFDLRRMEQQVDLEDGVADGEYHPDGLKLPSHCPNCEARMPAGKRLCQLCGHIVTSDAV